MQHVYLRGAVPSPGHRAVTGARVVPAAVRSTLDGPSGTGKSSVARAVATRLGAAYLDTGAMYRAATVAVLDAGVDLDDVDGIARAVSDADIQVGTAADAELVTVDGVDVAERIRGTEVTRAVSPVSAVPAVRRLLVDRQRALVAAADAVVVEGRDIGTVVLPDATLKIYLTAAPEVARRAPGRAARGHRPRPDRADRRRPAPPGRVRQQPGRQPAAPGCRRVVVDSTGLDREAVVERVLELARTAVGEPA